MSIFDSIKSALGKTDQPAEEVRAPSAVLRDAGIDPAGLKFGFGTNSLTVSGDVGSEDERRKILDVLSGLKGIETVQDNLEVRSPAARKPEPAADRAAPESAPASDPAQRTYTVVSGDTLWKIADRMYGNGSKYMKIFEANTKLLEHPDRIFPGQELVIPDLED